MKKSYLFAAFVFLFLQKAFPQANFDIEGNLCINNTLQFIDQSVVSVSDWNWNFGDGTNSIEQNPTHSYSDTGIFIIVLTIKSNGINYIATKTKYISALPLVGFTVDSTQVYYSTYSRVFIDSSTTFNPVAQYIWNFGDGSLPISTSLTSVLYKYTEKGTYNVELKIIDSKGCADSSFNIVNIHDRYYIPNVFTPNNDKKNDEFIITSNGETRFSIEIYSRWGNLVFKRDGHQQIIWDGHLPDGTLIKPGTYYYVINSESGNVTYDPEKGFITVFY